MASRKTWGGARPGAGPKPLPPEKRRSERVMFTLTPAELERLEQAAGDRPLSAYVRELVLRSLPRRQRRSKADR